MSMMCFALVTAEEYSYLLVGGQKDLGSRESRRMDLVIEGELVA